MGKRVDHDATQEVSSSQLVPDAKPPAYPGMAKNDASMWLQAPVSADDFVRAPKRPQAPRSSRTVVVGVLAVMFVAALGGGIWYAFLRESPGPSAVGPTTAPPAPAQPVTAAEPIDAAVAAAAPDAAPVDAAPDATGTEVAAVQADAVSSAGKLLKKKSVKRPAKKRHIGKKRTAKKRR